MHQASARLAFCCLTLVALADDTKAAATVQDSVTEPFIVTASDAWAPLAEPANAIVPGSVFDFSFLNDAPAGKQGPVVVTPDGHFEFANRPGVRVRFWGVNLVSSACYLDRETADRVAERIARSGYNSVRLHHIDRALAARDPATGDYASSGQLDPERLDQLEYLFGALKKRGLYINIDLYSLRLFSAQEMISFGLKPDAATGLSGGEAARLFKTALRFSPAAFDAWAAYARALLLHRNPHTGLTWAEDPALIGICPVNEDTDSSVIEKNPLLEHIYEREFGAWLERDDHRALLTGSNRSAVFGRFLIEAHQKTDARLFAFLRDLGVRVPLTGANHMMFQSLAWPRSAYDYVDNHQYWDHPQFLPGQRFRLPFRYHQKSATRDLARAPRTLMPTRIEGKPFAVTEFNFVRPNRYRAEGGVLMPAYASLQDWDALYNFEYASTAQTLSPTGDVTGGFSLASDPVGLLADRVSALLFLRGDIKPASGKIVFAVESDTAFSQRQRSFGDAFSRLGLVTRIGSLVGSPSAVREKVADLTAVAVDPKSASASLRTGIYPADDTLAERLLADGHLPPGSIGGGQNFRSDTGQITLDAKAGTARFVTPRSEGFVLPAAVRLQGEFATVRNTADTPCTVTVVALDSHDLAGSRRILVLQLSDSLPSGARFSSADRTLLEERGHPPLLVERAAAEIDLRLPADATLQAWAVDMDGTRLAAVPLEWNNLVSGWRLKAATLAGNKPRFAYEIVRE
ncbi:hypothetical protein OpiT1DRAFT_00510 [Opitutaceae bacterium TAV1]|nr:hypothetical protein OpiT1DRAFT_00510 [Opitutaceae bacterium TAV1]